MHSHFWLEILYNSLLSPATGTTRRRSSSGAQILPAHLSSRQQAVPQRQATAVKCMHLKVRQATMHEQEQADVDPA